MPDREGPKKICHEFPEETKINESKEHTCRSTQLIVVVIVVERKNHLRDPARRLPTGPPLPPARASRRRRLEPAGRGGGAGCVRRRRRRPEPAALARVPAAAAGPVAPCAHVPTSAAGARRARSREAGLTSLGEPAQGGFGGRQGQPWGFEGAAAAVPHQTQGSGRRRRSAPAAPLRPPRPRTPPKPICKGQARTTREAPDLRPLAPEGRRRPPTGTPPPARREKGEGEGCGRGRTSGERGAKCPPPPSSRPSGLPPASSGGGEAEGRKEGALGVRERRRKNWRWWAS
ncbi:hypothetical protein PVAP13_2NG348003 [Panicum virgatum]|uniref:Uncharacterized protein n=1 Tax=Panicum virgatum TaxID=38727 RepID=A0A8T0VAT3_PANVG|nr:hypothetical protein PVAP13_2NG348003 [Panicum virgatum]